MSAFFPIFFFRSIVSHPRARVQDKAIKRFHVRNIVDSSAIKDLVEASIIEDYQLPKVPG